MAENLSQHVLPTSAVMIGVCMTVISILKLVHVGPIDTVIDRLLAFDSLVFLASAALSYASMRNERHKGLERHADVTFMIGLMGLAVCSLLLAFELI